MKKLFQRKLNNIHQFFFDGKSKKESIIFFRIIVGFFLMIHFLSIQTDFETLYGENSFIPSDIQTVYMNNVFLFNEIIDGINWIVNDTQTSVFIFKGLYIFLCLTIILGFFSRLSAIILIFLQIGLMKSSYYFAYGVDYFSSMSLVYIILYPSDKYFSLRKILWSYNTSQEDSPFFKLQKIHLNIIYCVSGIEKLTGYNWRNGEAIWKSIHLPNFSNDFNININYLGKFPLFFIIIGFAAILIEMLYPIFMNIKKSRGIWLIATISLHLGIATFLNLYFFSTLMIIWNITIYYFDNNEVKATNEI